MANNAEILLKLILDESEARDFDRGVKRAEDGLDDFDDSVEKTTEALRIMGEELDNIKEDFDNAKESADFMAEAAGKITSISETIAVAGAAITGSIVATAKGYVEAMKDAGGEGEVVATRWLEAEERVKAAFIDIGRISATAILPTLEKAADLAEKGADFVEDHPGIVKAALNIGVVTASIGAIGALVGKGITFFADIKLLAAMTQYSLSTAAFSNSVHEYALASGLGGKTGAAGGVLGKVLGAGGAGGVGSAAAGGAALSAAAVAASVLGGVGIGVAAYNKIAEAEGLADAGTVAKQALFVMKVGLEGFVQESVNSGRMLAQIATTVRTENRSTIKEISTSFIARAKLTAQQYKAERESVAMHRLQIASIVTSSLARELQERVSYARQTASAVGGYLRQTWQSMVTFLAGIGSSIIEAIKSMISGIFNAISNFSLGDLSGRALGGYANTGVYKLAESGQREFVMSGQTTKAAERSIGGALSQGSILAALGGGRSVTLNDNRRIDSEVSPRTRRAITEDTLNAMTMVMNGA